jgi:hypothetical protein
MKRLPCFLFLLLVSASVFAQSNPGNFYARFSARTNAIQATQPSWPPPLVTTYVPLFQVVRSDFVRQVTPTHTDTWNMGNSKGVSVIPFNHVEIDVNLPPYFRHNSPSVEDGWGDMSFLGKYRIASGNEQNGNYAISVFALATVPTGQYKNGAATASIAPNLGVGKGFGKLAIQTTAGTTLYTGKPATTTAGNPVAWNLATQYHASRYFWPELESNATWFKGGTNNGKMQEFITPGILVGKLKLRPEDPKSRPGLTFGGGMQIATSQFHTYNHSLVLTARWIY